MESLCPKPESLRSVFVDQNTGNYGVQHTKGNTRYAEHQNWQTQVHHGVTHHISQDHDDSVGAAFHLRPRRVGLEQIVDGEIVDGEKHTHE